MWPVHFSAYSRRVTDQKPGWNISCPAMVFFGNNQQTDKNNARHISVNTLLHSCIECPVITDCFIMFFCRTEFVSAIEQVLNRDAHFKLDTSIKLQFQRAQVPLLFCVCVCLFVFPRLYPHLKQ